MFNIFGSNKSNKIKYSHKNLQQDIENFITIFFKHLDTIDNIELVQVIKDFTNNLNVNYSFIVIYRHDLNALEDYNENEGNKSKKFQVSNIEDFIGKLEKNIFLNIDKIKSDLNNDLTNKISNLISDSTFEFIEFKRNQLYKLKESSDTEIDFPYFGSMYRYKSLHENIVMPSGLEFKKVHNDIFKLLDREGLDKMHLFLGNILKNYINDEENVEITPELITAISFNAKNYIETINNDYIISKGNTNVKNTLSIDECLGQKYLPIFNAPQEVIINGSNEKSTINKVVIVTTIDTILNRFKGDIGNDIDSLGYSLSHFGNMIEIYDDENLFKKYLILSNDDFKKFFDYISYNDKAFDEALNPDKKKQRNLEEADIGTGETKKEFDALVLEAILMGATDIHLKIFDGKGHVDIRTKTGIIKTFDKIPQENLLKIVRMLSGDSKVNEFGIEVPQDGEQHRTIEDKKTNIKYEVDLRFGFAQGLERVYIRLGSVISNGEKRKLSLNDLGYEQEDLDIINGMCENNSNGLILVTGPTGSGKTTLLYGILEHQIPNRPEIHLLTAEDPIERKLNFHNVDQNKITEKATSKILLKSFLRQDPDWILIGETRDKELLSMVIEASQTGHLTFSTYHTNNTVETLERLSKMYAGDNVENFGLARDSLLAILRGIVSVILVPKLCPFCKVKIEREEVIERIRKKGIEEEKITQLVDKNGEFYKRNLEGCGKCDNGFNGKQTINEIMNLSNHKIHYDVKHNNYSGIVTQFEKGMKYVNKGLIDVDTLAKNASK